MQINVCQELREDFPLALILKNGTVDKAKRPAISQLNFLPSLHAGPLLQRLSEFLLGF